MPWFGSRGDALGRLAGGFLGGIALSSGPLLQDVTIAMGAKTPPGMGTVLLKNLGLVVPGSAPIVSWRTSNVVATGGANTDLGGLLATNTAAATARSPTPTLGAANDLTTVTLPGASYSVTVTGVAAGGAEATCTLTITPRANAFSFGDDNASFGRPDNLDSLSTVAGLRTKTGGLTWLISTGADLTGGLFDITDFSPASGRTTVTYADPARPSRIPGLKMTAITNFDFDGLGIGGSVNHKIFFNGPQSGTAASSSTGVTVKNCYSLGDSFADVNPISGSATNQHFIDLTGAISCTVDNCSFRWGGRGIVLNNTSGCTVTNNTIRYCFGDLCAIGISTNDVVTGNLALSPMRELDTSGNPDHVDNMQWDGGAVTNLTFAGNIFAAADGTAAASGFQGGAFAYANVTYAGNISLFRASTAANLAIWQDSTLRDSTWLLVGSGKIGMQALGADDNVFNGQPGFGNSDGHGGFLGSGANALTRVFVPYAKGFGGTSWTITNSPDQHFSIPNAVQFTYNGVTFNREPDMGGSTYATSGVLKYANTLERLNNYNAVTNPAGADYPNMTPAQIKALILDVLTPATGGSLDLGGGNTNTIGAVCLDGTLKPLPSAFTSIKMDTTGVKMDAATVTMDHT